MEKPVKTKITRECPQADNAIALSALKSRIQDPHAGLPEDIFLFASSITPMVNVDLLVRDSAGRILLSWRDDEFCGQGWHVPGGIVRFRERLLERLQRTALAEFGCPVRLEAPEPELVEFFRPDGQNVRGHFITFIYHCRLAENPDTPPDAAKPGEVGHLAFHASFPENMIPVHNYYRKFFSS